MSGSLAPQAQSNARDFATTRDQYVRMVENSILADLKADLAGAPDLAMKLAFVEAAAERLGHMEGAAPCVSS